MLHEIIADYLDQIEQTVLQYCNISVDRYVEEILTSERVNLRIRIRFKSGHLLEISEAVVAKNNRLIHLDYRYHCQDQQNHLIFRYDNTPHFPRLSTFPHHKHLSDDVVAWEKPDLRMVIEEAVQVSA